MHSRADKFIEIPEQDNWLDAGYNYGTILKEKFRVHCPQNEKEYSTNVFFDAVRAFVLNKKGQKPKGSSDIEIVQITVRDIVDSYNFFGS